MTCLPATTRIHGCQRTRPTRGGDAQQSESDAAIEPIAATVQIDTEDGRRHLKSQSAARGSDGNPMSDAALEHELRQSFAQWNGECEIDPLIDAIRTLDKRPEAASLLALSIP
jgi:hypothetical protein